MHYEVSCYLQPLYCWVNSLRYLLDGRLSGFRTDADAVEKRKFSCPFLESNLDSSAVKPGVLIIPTEIF
jgi:hypothetical protein